MVGFITKYIYIYIYIYEGILVLKDIIGSGTHRVFIKTQT